MNDCVFNREVDILLFLSLQPCQVFSFQLISHVPRICFQHKVLCLFFFRFFVQELLAIQQQGPRSIGFFGTRNMGFMHQELIEILSYAMVITVRCYNWILVCGTVCTHWAFQNLLYCMFLICCITSSCRRITFIHQEHLELMQLSSEVL